MTPWWLALITRLANEGRIVGWPDGSILWVVKSVKELP